MEIKNLICLIALCFYQLNAEIIKEKGDTAELHEITDTEIEGEISSDFFNIDRRPKTPFKCRGCIRTCDFSAHLNILENMFCEMFCRRWMCPFDLVLFEEECIKKEICGKEG